MAHYLTTRVLVHQVDFTSKGFSINAHGCIGARRIRLVSIYSLKPRFQTILRPLCGLLANLGITANQVTIAAILLSGGAGICIVLFPDHSWPLLLLPIVLFVRMALNAIDGMLAREFGMKSRLGAVLNEIGDVLSDSFLYLPFALIVPLPAWGIVVVILLAIMVEMMGVIAVQIGASRRYDGPFGKSDRACAFGVLGMLLGLGVFQEEWAIWYLGVMIFLSVVTLWRRAANALEEARTQAQ